MSAVPIIAVREREWVDETWCNQLSFSEGRVLLLSIQTLEREQSKRWRIKIQAVDLQMESIIA